MARQALHMHHGGKSGENMGAMWPTVLLPDMCRVPSVRGNCVVLGPGDPDSCGAGLGHRGMHKEAEAVQSEVQPVPIRHVQHAGPQLVPPVRLQDCGCRERR